VNLRLILVPLLFACCGRAQELAALHVQDAVPARSESATVIALSAPRHGHRIEQLAGGLLSFGGFGDAFAVDRETRQTFWLAPGGAHWQRRADMHVGRAFFASAAVDGVVYAIGEGLERYDFAQDRWIELLPAEGLPRTHFAAAALGRTLYVLGGYGGQGADLIAIDLDTLKLRRESAPPGFSAGDHFQFVHAIAGRLHVIGGLESANFKPRREHWVLSDQGWQAQAPPPEGLWAKFAVQAVDDDKLYLFGEFGGFCFDAKNSSWTERARFDGLLAMPQTVARAGKLWVIGGELAGAKSAAWLHVYDIAADQWILAPTRPGAPTEHEQSR
jgi:hypothetical protein